MKIVIVADGPRTRLFEESSTRPSSTVDVGPKPMLRDLVVSASMGAVRWDDPQNPGVELPTPISTISSRDRETSLWLPAH